MNFLVRYVSLATFFLQNVVAVQTICCFFQHVWNADGRRAVAVELFKPSNDEIVVKGDINGIYIHPGTLTMHPLCTEGIYLPTPFAFIIPCKRNRVLRQ